MSSPSIEEKLSPTETTQEVAYEAEFPHDQVDARRVFRKLDLRLVPLACLLYLLSFLYVLSSYGDILQLTHYNAGIVQV